jgi:hypothetical protein
MSFKQIAEEFGVTPMYVGRLRKKLFPDSEELDEDMIKDLRIYLASIESSKEEVKEVLKPELVLAQLDSYAPWRKGVAMFMLLKERKKVWALVPRDMEMERLKGRNTQLERIVCNDKEYYRHASITAKVFPPFFEKYGVRRD